MDPRTLSATRPGPRTKSVHVEVERTFLRSDKVRRLVGNPSGSNPTLSKTGSHTRVSDKVWLGPCSGIWTLSEVCGPAYYAIKRIIWNSWQTTTFRMFNYRVGSGRVNSGRVGQRVKSRTGSIFTSFTRTICRKTTLNRENVTYWLHNSRQTMEHNNE